MVVPTDELSAFSGAGADQIQVMVEPRLGSDCDTPIGLFRVVNGHMPTYTHGPSGSEAVAVKLVRRWVRPGGHWDFVVLGFRRP